MQLILFLTLLLGSSLGAQTQTPQALEDREAWLKSMPKEYRKKYESFLSPSFDGAKAPARWSHWKNGIQIFHLKLPEDVEDCPNIGYCHRRNLQVFHAGRTQEKVLFFTTYEYDHRGLRKTPFKVKPHHNKHLFLAGGSFTLGTSLPSQSTLAGIMGQTKSPYYPTTLAVAGSGPNTLLALFRERVKKADVRDEEGAFVLVYNDFFIERASAFAIEREWLHSSMVYEKDNEGVLIRMGSFDVVQPIRTWVYQKLLGFFRSFGLPYNFPRRHQSHVTYACDLIEGLKSSYLNLFPKGSFLIYDHPYHTMDSRLKDCLTTLGHSIFESQFKWSADKHQIPLDEHPNLAGNAAVAREILMLLP